MTPLERVLDIEKKITALDALDLLDGGGESLGFRERRKLLIENELRDVDGDLRRRLMDEFDGWGPLTALLERPQVTEILVNGPDSVWFEEGGRLHAAPTGFLSGLNYERMIERLCLEAGTHLSVERPSADGRWRHFRVHVSRPPVTRTHSILSLRRHPENPWTLDKLLATGWCDETQAVLLREMIRRRWNFLVIGSTGGGKTSVVNALLAEAGHDRAAILEDSDEIAVPAGPSLKLLTRKDSQGLLPEVTLTDLVRQSLRLRPDRLVVGEVRGGEAKDFLLALSTGHSGSFGTLHADSPAQALMRLEMLVQMGAPEWSLETVRRLLRLSLQAVVVTGKNENGERRFRGLHRLVSLEENGFVMEPVEFFPRD